MHVVTHAEPQTLVTLRPIADVVNGYQITATLYQSTRTLVHRAIRLLDGKPVVVKAIRSDNPHPRELAQLRREYRAAQRVQGPGVVQVRSLEPWLKSLAIIFDDFGASSLADLPRTNAVDHELFLSIALLVTRALVHVHEHIIHGDLTPSNILWNPSTGDVRLTDFGFASEIRREHRTLVADHLSETSLPYVSPERSGRTNRDLDHRADLYSLGITLYELLTGSLPFAANNRAEWIYCHVTQKPRPPSAVNASAPEVLSRIILRLIEKSPEERYQSARGLLRDLEECRAQRADTGRIDPFVLGRGDAERELRLSRRLYGRNSESAVILGEFEAVARGGNRMLMVYGEPGVGKSAIINEIRRPIFSLDGYFIEGKFDQFARLNPYAGFSQAIRQLVVQLLTEPEERLARWASDLRDALGPNGQLVVDLVPELERIIGPQRAIAPGNAVEEQNRFQITIHGFIRIFARVEHPLVLFLDDLQWADVPTLNLVEGLSLDREIGSLLFIGAYRAGEEADNAALTALLERLKQRDSANSLMVGPLTATAVNEFTAGLLNALEDDTRALAGFLGERTKGNPLFLNEAIHTINRVGALYFDLDRREWRWNLARIREVLASDDVVDLIALRLLALSPVAMTCLTLASYIGTPFDLRTLSLVSERSSREIAHALWEAVREGLVVPMNDDYRLVLGDGSDLFIDAAGVDVRYRFQHDRVQQAAHAVVPAGERARMHLKLGRLLRERCTGRDREERLLEIVHQLNEGAALMESDEERVDLAAMNLEAARRILRSAAYLPAFSLLQIGAKLLPTGSWSSHFTLTYELQHCHAACAYLVGQSDLAGALSTELLRHARSPLEGARVYAMQLTQLTFCDRMDDAVAAGLRGLRMLGVRMTARPSAVFILSALIVARRRLGRRLISDLGRAPVIHDPSVRLCMRILIDFLPPAYLTGNDKLFAASVLKQADLSMKHGSGPESASAYASYVVLLAGLGEYSAAYQFGQLALGLTEQFDIDAKCRNQVLYAVFAHSWSRPWRELRKLFEEVVKAGLDSGDMLFTAYACGWVHLWDPDVDLRTASSEGRKYMAIIEKSHYQNAHDVASLAQQLWANLAGETKHRLTLSDQGFDEGACYDRMKRLKNVSGLGILALYRIKLCLYDENYQRGLEIIEDSDAVIRALAGSPYIVEYHIHAFLICASLASAPRGGRARRRMRTLSKQMTKWAVHSRVNFGQHALLMDAEWAALRGDVGAAARLYEQAILAAREGGFARYEALANERAARFFLAAGLQQVASSYLDEARYQYVRWGATAKVRSLEERHPTLLRAKPKALADRESPPVGSSPVLGTRHAQDIETIWIASQALSEEVVLERMLERFMVILRENGGATRGVLILREHDSHQLLVEAETRASGPVSVLEHRPIESADVPRNLVRYVDRSSEAVVVDDTADRRDLMNDPYLRACRARSLLAMPILHGGNSLGVLYLENDLATHVFTPERLTTLQMLSSQAAISLRNARLYQHVQQMAESFSRFVPREFLRSLGRSHFLDIQLGESVQKSMTVLFCDMRGFTALVEQMSPADNVGFVNSYFSYMEPAILSHGGFVDSYIGDAIMALFDRPPDFAVRAALAMLRALEDFNGERERAGAARVAIGIGVNSGNLTLGTIGGTERLKCGVIGDTVNVGARIESLTKRYGVSLLISGSTYVDLPSDLRRSTRFVGRVRVAGHLEALDLFEVFDADPAPLRESKQAALHHWRLAVDLFYSRRFADAAGEFAKLVATLPGDKVASRFAERAGQFQRLPPEESWTGVEEFVEK